MAARGFPPCGHYEAGLVPPEYDSGFLLVEAGRVTEVERKIDTSRYHRIPLRIHLADDPVILFLRKEVFIEAPSATAMRLAE